MKKVLSVALASAMVMGMGVTSFADISYNTGAGNKKVDWPTNIQFDGNLTIVNSDASVVEDGDTLIETTSQDAEFRPGDVIYMPLFADNQEIYRVRGGQDEIDSESGKEITVDVNYFDPDTNTDVYSNIRVVGGHFDFVQDNQSGFVMGDENGTYRVVPKNRVVGESGLTAYIGSISGWQIEFRNSDGTWTTGRDITGINVYEVGTHKRLKVTQDNAAAYNKNPENYYVTLTTAGIKGQDGKDGKIYATGEYEAYYNYTGAIGSNWSVNFKEKSADYVKNAEFHRATAKDVADLGLVPNAVYVKVSLKDTFDSVDKDEIYYEVYVAENGKNNKTDVVYVKGTYANEEVEWVSFDHINHVNGAKVWKVKDGEMGTAVFDFNDVAYFTVKMYSGDKVRLDLDAAYNTVMGKKYDADLSFANFNGTHDAFDRNGELFIISKDKNLHVYEVENNEPVAKVDAEYVTDYKIAHLGGKYAGYKFTTKELGNYVLSSEELAVSEKPVNPEAPSEKPVNPGTGDKENPSTGANDFVGVAVALAVVSVAAAGALALKK